jgi:hypothetical protein
MILADDWVEDISKVLVGIGITSIDSAVLVIKLNGTGYGLRSIVV